MLAFAPVAKHMKLLAHATISKKLAGSQLSSDFHRDPYVCWQLAAELN
jgi:hypothetical protein